MAHTIPYSLLGLQVSGDLDGVTIYTDRFGKKVWFPKAPPTKPPSPLQIAQRLAFKNAQNAWSILTPQQKQNLEDATRKLSLCLTGQNLWIHLILRNAAGLRDTIERQSGITLPAL